MATTITGSGVDNIIDGTIVDADINSSAAITASKLSGAGKVLQVVNSIFTTAFSHSSAQYTDPGHSVNITPKSSSSVLYLEWVGNVSSNGINGMSVAFREGSTSIGGGSAEQGGIFYYDDTYTNNTHINQSMMTVTASTGLTTRTFKISTKITHGSGTNGCKYEGAWGPCMLKVTEIAQ